MLVNAYPSFLNVFGIKAPDGTLNIPPSWQNGIAGATNCGEIIGLQVAGVMSDRVGYRWTLILALISLTSFIFIPFYGISGETLSFGNQKLIIGSKNIDRFPCWRATAGYQLGGFPSE